MKTHDAVRDARVDARVRETRQAMFDLRTLVSPGGGVPPAAHLPSLLVEATVALGRAKVGLAHLLKERRELKDELELLKKHRAAPLSQERILALPGTLRARAPVPASAEQAEELVGSLTEAGSELGAITVTIVNELRELEQRYRAWKAAINTLRPR